MKCDQDLCLNFWYDLRMLLWQDDLNPRVRCAFGNVFLFYRFMHFSLKMNFDLSIFVGICLILQNVSTTTLHCALVIESTCLIKVVVLPSKRWWVNAKPPVKGGEWGDCGGGDGGDGLGLGLGLLLGSSDGLPQEDRQDRQQGHQQSQHGLTPSFWGHQTLLVS